jgi:NitT/TauT family transport system substrate-binding protein
LQFNYDPGDRKPPSFAHIFFQLHPNSPNYQTLLEVAMDARLLPTWSRRGFLGRLTAASAVGLLGLRPGVAAAEPPPETTTINIVFDPTFAILCYGPQYVATEMLKLEGFTEINYVPYLADEGPNDANVVAAGRADISTAWAGDLLESADRHNSVVALSGMHLGCTEIFAHQGIKSFRDLKGKKIALYAEGSAEHIWFSMMLAYIGVDPLRDVEWAIHPYEEWSELLTAGKVDAIMLWPPDSQIFREQKIGHVILNTTTDRPWKDYYCCVVSGNREFVHKHPVATKRALRAMLKATDMCALEPELAARAVVANGFPTEYERALQVFREIPYAQWREYDPEDTLRFFALRMHKLGLIKQSPDDLVDQIADWRFLNELKRELKA